MQILLRNQFRFTRRPKNGIDKRFGLRFRKTGFFQPFSKLERIERECSHDEDDSMVNNKRTRGSLPLTLRD